MDIHAMPGSSRCVKAVNVNAFSSFPQYLLYEDSNNKQKPQQIFPLPCDPAGLYPSSNICKELARNGKNFVKVNGVGTEEVQPDVIVFCVKITSRKSDLNECRSSIKKREDYVISILKKNSVKQYTSTEIVQRDEVKAEVGGDDGDKAEEEKPQLFIVTKEICATANEISKYFNVASTCQEKLDSRVEISRPVVNISISAMDKATQNALEMANKNARSRALALIQTKSSEFRSSLGAVMYTMENSVSVDALKEYESSDFESLRWKKLCKRIIVQITTVFELKNERNENYKIIL